MSKPGDTRGVGLRNVLRHRAAVPYAFLASFGDIAGWRSALVRLCPLWWVYILAVSSFVAHDCKRNRIRCFIGEHPISALAWLDRWQSKDYGDDWRPAVFGLRRKI